MPTPSVGEVQILEALRRVPSGRWGEVLAFLDSLQGAEAGGGPPAPIHTARDLAESGLVGLWAGRTDLGDSRTFARRLREQAERRGGGGDAAGH
jgi:hypothetical protein